MWLFIGILLQESSPTFDKVSELVTKLVSCYVHDPYFITFGHLFLDKNLGLVDSIYQRYGNLQILEFDFFIARKIQNRVSAKIIRFCY